MCFLLVDEEKKFNIDDFFNKFMKMPEIYKKRDVLGNYFIPDELPHRDDQIRAIAQIMVCVLRSSTSLPSNIFLYGKPGTGKTAVIKHVLKKLAEKCLSSNMPAPNWVYINCNRVSSGYRILANIYNDIDPENPVSSTGLPKDVLLKRLCSLLDEKIGNAVCFIILDEIDSIKNKTAKDNLLYILSRINETLKKCKINIIGISNVLNFKDDLDSRVCSSLCEEEIVFPAYQALELYEILKRRISAAFIPGIVSEGAIRLCSALAAKENGDARRALSLLRRSGDIIARRGLTKLTEAHIYMAQNQIDRDRTEIFIKDLPMHQKAILLSIYLNFKYKQKQDSSSGEIYSTYCELLSKTYGLNKLTSRRVSTLVKELDLAGITSSKVVSFGRKGGRTRMISLKANDEIVVKCLKKDTRWTGFVDFKPSHAGRSDINVQFGRKYLSLIPPSDP